MTSSTNEHLHEDIDKKVCLECNRQFTGIVAACPHDNSLLVPVAQDPLIGTRLVGKYDIVSVLGTGGMGVVYKGRQDVMDRTVAIKMLQAHHLNDSMSVKRFQQESKATCRLSHPNIITVYDFGISPSGQPYIVMDYLEGKSVSDILREEGQLGVERTLKIIGQACHALGHAHKQGIIHRDLKPSNIVLIEYEGDKDFVKVVDFGVAKFMEEGSTEGQKLTQMGEVCGSPVYMSPEQCQGLPLDKRSDIYSMGVVVYEILTNRLPILGKTMVETMSKHINEDPPAFSETRPDLYIPERVEQVILRALAKRPEDRQQSMEQLATELEMAIPKPGRSQVLRTGDFADESEEETKSSDGQWYQKFSLVHWSIIILVALGIGAFALIGIFNMFKGESSERAIERKSQTKEAVEKPKVEKPAAKKPEVLPAQKTDEKEEENNSVKETDTKPDKAESNSNETEEKPKPAPKPKAVTPRQTTPKPAPRTSRPTPKPTPKPAPKPKAQKSPWSDLKDLRSY